MIDSKVLSSLRSRAPAVGWFRKRLRSWFLLLTRILGHLTSLPFQGQPGSLPVQEHKERSRNEEPNQTLREPSFLTFSPHALPPDLQSRTTVLPFQKDVRLERVFRYFHLHGVAARAQALRRAWALFREAPEFNVVITTGTLDGLTYAFLQKLRGPRRPINVMHDCYWYGGNWLRRAWMRSCLRLVDCCVVWASVERTRYANAYGVSQNKFAFVRHHHTLKRYQFEVGDDGYIFTGGDSDRDYGPLLEAIRDLPVPCVMATRRPQLLTGLQVPANVRVVSATPAEFRQLMARSRMVVVPMRANLLRTGGQQTFLNAMYMSKPAILTDPEGGVDYIQHGKTGLLVPHGDAEALRNAIQYLWEHPEDARVMGERGQEAAVPLTTERCNVEIWNLALGLLASGNNLERSDTAQSHRS